MKDSTAFYKSNITTAEAEISSLKKQLFGSSMLRLVLFLATAGVFYWMWGDTSILIGVAVVFFIGFILLVSRHSDIKLKKLYAEELKKLNELELKIAAREYLDQPTGTQYLQGVHEYAQDIDLFGRGALFQYINRTATPAGEGTFAQALLSNDATQVEEKQAAIQELAQLPAWRQEFYARAKMIQSDMRIGAITDWVEEYKAFVPSVMRWLPFAWMAVFVILLVCYQLDITTGHLPGGWFILGLTVVGRFVKKVNKLAIVVSQVQEVFREYGTLIGLIEQQEFKSSLLNDKKQEIITSGEAASLRLKRFAKILANLDQRNNLLMGFLVNGIMLWDELYSYKLEQWIEENRSEVKKWFDLIAWMDDMNTRANYAYNHPQYIYPEITAAPIVLNATDTIHPLLDPTKAVGNDIKIDRGNFFIITGANMAGKSTYLRDVALMIVLSNMGLPVPAASCEYNPIQLISSMRTSDDLTQDESYFYAELKRLRYVIDTLSTGDYFIILDEILKGTNSVDKANGSRKLIERLTQMKATGIIATHDLSLTKVADGYDEAHNYYFDAQIVDDELYFDYKMKPGVCSNMNASFLLKKMGIVTD